MVTESEIEAATAYKMTREQIDLFDPKTIEVLEEKGTGEVAKELAKARVDRTRNAAVNFGTWITNDRGDGLALVVPVGTSYVHLQDADGDIYEIKFKDIPQYAKLASGKPQRFSRAGLML